MAYILTMPDLRDLERNWAISGSDKNRQHDDRKKRLVGWCLLTLLMGVFWVASWSGGGAALGHGLQLLYGVDQAVAPLWLRGDIHLHMFGAALVTLWGSWAGRLFTPVGSWLGPPIAVILVIIDELLQIGQQNRSFEWEDPIAGGVGILLAMSVLGLLAVMGQRPGKHSFGR